MADMRRNSPEPPPGMPRIEHKPGMANEMLQELGPLLAEEGIDVDDIEVDDMDTLQRAFDRAVERRNLELFTPIGPAREVAVTTLRQIVEAILAGDSVRAGRVLDYPQPEAPDDSVPTVAACTGTALGLLDEHLGGHTADAPAGLAGQATLPPGHWTGKRAATDILALAGKGRAFRSLDALTARQGGAHVLAGSVLALAAVTQAWAQRTNTPHADLIQTTIR